MEYFSTPESSNITQIGYEKDSLILLVEFKTGNTYHYYDVPEQIWEAFVSAPSKGQYINQSIKGQYRYSKI